MFVFSRDVLRADISAILSAIAVFRHGQRSFVGSLTLRATQRTQFAFG